MSHFAELALSRTKSSVIYPCQHSQLEKKKKKGLWPSLCTSKGRREPICKFICCLCRIPAFLPLFTHLLSGHAQTPAKGFFLGHHVPPRARSSCWNTGQAQRGKRKARKWVTTEGCFSRRLDNTLKKYQFSADLLSTEAHLHTWRSQTLLKSTYGLFTPQKCFYTPSSTSNSAAGT